MIIDIHGHVSAPSELYAYKANLLSHRGAHGVKSLKLSDDLVREAMTKPIPNHGGISHLQHLDDAGIDLQLIYARPYTVMHSEEPVSLVEGFIRATNDVVKQVVDLFPGRFHGVAALPQSPRTEPAAWLGELHRCVRELDFVGAMINSDPSEGQHPPVPAMGNRYWYPVYEALCELDVPGVIHSASCRPPSRESYNLHFILEETISLASLLTSSVFQDFPTLKLIVSHGGGAVPYHLGRFLSQGVRDGKTNAVSEALSSVYFDTCLYTKESLELLFKVIGTERCMYGSEKPGTGSRRNPNTGRWYDDLKVLIEEIDWLSESQRDAVFELNARSIFKL